MGIQGLIPFLKKCTRSAHISHFSGQCVAIDAYCWLHKGAYACVEKLARGEPCDAYVTYCMKLVNMLLSYNIKPILVFDGRHLPAKAKTELKRRESRQQSRARAAELLRAGRTEEARNYLRRSIDITHSMAVDLMRECRTKNVDCIVAPYEADAQLAYLNLKNIAQVVITEDSDLVLFGCNMVMFKMDITGNGLLVEKEKLHLAMGSNPENFEFDKFRHMCILSGCDYLPSLPGIGLAKALKFVTKTADPDIHRALRRLPLHLNMHGLSVSNEYRDEFIQAVATFKYQLVYDPMTRKLVPLNEPPDGYEHDNYVGEMMPDDVAFQLALGNLDPFTLKPVDDFNPDWTQKQSLAVRQSGVSSHPSIWTSDSVLSTKELQPQYFKKAETEVKIKRIVITDTGEDIHTSGELQALYGTIKSNASPRLTDDSGIMEDDRSSEEEPHPKKQCIDESQKENQYKSPRKKLNLSDALSPVLTQRKPRNPFALSINREQIQSISNIERDVISSRKVKLFKKNVETGAQVIRSRYFTSNSLEPKSDKTGAAQKDSSENSNTPTSDSIMQLYSAACDKSLSTDERGKLSNVSDPVEKNNSVFFALENKEVSQCDVVDFEDSLNNLTQPISQYTSQSSNLGTQQSQSSNLGTQESQSSNLGTQESQSSNLGTQESQSSNLGTKESQSSNLGTKESQSSNLGTEESQSSNLGTQESQSCKLVTPFDSGLGENNSMSDDDEKPLKTNTRQVSVTEENYDSIETFEKTDNKPLTGMTTPLTQKKAFASVFKWRKVDIEITENKISDISELLREKFGTTTSSEYVGKDDKTSLCDEEVANFTAEQRSHQLKSQKKLYQGLIFNAKRSPAQRPLSRSVGSCRKQGLNKNSQPKEKSLLQQNLLTLFGSQKEKQL